MLVRLFIKFIKQSGLGCHINGTYMGVLGYADDITLTCPSLYGLNDMLDVTSLLRIIM